MYFGLETEATSKTGSTTLQLHSERTLPSLRDFGNLLFA